MNWFLILCAIVSVLISATVAQYPNISKLVIDGNRSYSLKGNEDSQKNSARTAASDFREYALHLIWPALRMTVLAFLVTTVGLLIASAFWLELDRIAPAVGQFISSKLEYVFRWEATRESELAAKMSPIADWFISMAFLANLGSIVSFFAGTAITFAISAVFPLRWLKWTRLPRYFQGAHNFWPLKKRQLLLILSSKVIVSGPSSGVHDS